MAYLVKSIFCVSLLSVGLTQFFTGYPGSFFISNIYMTPPLVRWENFYIKPGSTEIDISSRSTSLYMQETSKTYEELAKVQTYNSMEFTRRVYDDDEKPFYQYIADHTFKLKTPCNEGTGWIMDFEIPKTPKTYPTTWYLATNMHVITGTIFKNPYGLETSTTYTDYSQAKKNYCSRATSQKTPLILSRTTIPIGQEYELENKDGSSSDVKIKSVETPDKSVEIKDPALIYHALNFAGDRYTETGYIIRGQNYYKDFAVLEVTFDNEAEAKHMTDDYYNKYYKNPKTGDKPVNLFAPELMYSKKHAELSQIEAYTGGYSIDDDKHFSANVISKKHIAEVFNLQETGLFKDEDLAPTKIKTTMFDEQYWNTDETIDFLMNKDQKPIIGHKESIRMGVWQGKIMWDWGYDLFFKNSFVTHGDSGSMAIDKDKNLLGIFTTIEYGTNAGYATVLKSEGIFDGRKIISPKYDLIRGVEGQPMSYKSQLTKFHPEMTTYLTSINWGEPQEVQTTEVTQ